ncbi:MAG: hypothetical protein IKS48_01575 [Eubacterium sp.]|nr:hypothetical protein [Eubacterium sp.]
MVKRMQVKDIIVKNFNDRLLKNGLEYDAFDGICWKFSQKETPFAIMHIQKFRHAPNMIKLCVYNKYYEMIDSSEEMEIDGFENQIGGFFHYENENELIEILGVLFDYLEENALPKVLDDYNNTNDDEEMNFKLYENHKKYYKEFIIEHSDVYKEQEGIQSNSLCEFMDNEITRIRNLNDDSQNDELIKLAAFYGTVLEKEFLGEWALIDFGDEKRVAIEKMQNEEEWTFVLKNIMDVYREEIKIGAIKFMLDYMIETKK